MSASPQYGQLIEDVARAHAAAERARVAASDAGDAMKSAAQSEQEALDRLRDAQGALLRAIPDNPNGERGTLIGERTIEVECDALQAEALKDGEFVGITNDLALRLVAEVRSLRALVDQNATKAGQ